VTQTDDNFDQFDLGLSDRESFFIGRIIALWGALEHEVFVQTLATFASNTEEALPKAMNNLQFTGVLALWKERVVDKAEGSRAEVLQRQHERISQLHDHRNALVHGMWDWSAAELSKITVMRIRKNEIHTTHFTADDLMDFSLQLGGINFQIRFPNGLEDFAKQKADSGISVSRRGLSMLLNDPIGDDWLPLTPPSKDAS
jgi:hypothetical protein